ncbi:MAG: nucleotidyl transferase AbiEii/AbiGii toxin family protein [Candidatus Margulisbacteria bacterium]|nr:nucleotidyl transferase AbiEii/AbiGii toxin family protein [Candidatus Margulisiibacteriota bacterium]
MHWLFEWFKGKKIYYEEILRKLHEKKVDYILVGGMAVSLYKVAPRFTMDIDLMVAFVPENVEKFISVLNELGYKPKAPIDPKEFADQEKRKIWINEKNMKVFAFYHPDRAYELVDVFIEHPIDYKELSAEKRIVRLKGMEIPIPSKKHLIALKKIAGRPDDLIDIENLEALPPNDEVRNGE